MKGRERYHGETRIDRCALKDRGVRCATEVALGRAQHAKQCIRAMHAPAVFPEPEMPPRRNVAATAPPEAAGTYQCPRDDPNIFARKRAFDEGAE
jgi:hypothetical protein